MEAIRFINGELILLDQTKLPGTIEYYICKDYQSCVEAIKTMKVRGAPAIGVAAAYGVVLAAQQYVNNSNIELEKEILKAAESIKAARPTAVNLFWAVERMLKKVINKNYNNKSLLDLLRAEADLIQKEDLEMNIRMGEYGQELISNNSRILTHCNAGALATAGYGTALGVIRSAHKRKKVSQVFVDETRPLLQGARLTAFELLQDGLNVKLITDNMAAFLMQQKKIDCIIVGADRIAANGDTANKIGTYGLAVLANFHKIPFYVAAPVSTFDFNLKTGKEIPIEERKSNEVKTIGDVWIAPQEVEVYNPAFDITPGELITAIVTDRGIIYPPFSENLKRMKD